MRDYRLYFRTLDTNQAITRVELIEARDDVDAHARALRHVGDYNMELWARNRKVATIGPDGRDLGPPPRSSILWACIAEGRSPTVHERNDVVARTLQEAFPGAQGARARKMAAQLTDVAFHGRRTIVKRAA